MNLQLVVSVRIWDRKTYIWNELEILKEEDRKTGKELYEDFVLDTFG